MFEFGTGKWKKKIIKKGEIKKHYLLGYLQKFALVFVFLFLWHRKTLFIAIAC